MAFNPLISEKSATVRVASRRRERRRRRLARRAASSALTVTLSKNASTAGRKLRQRGHRALEILARDMLAGVALGDVENFREHLLLRQAALAQDAASTGSA